MVSAASRMWCNRAIAAARPLDSNGFAQRGRPRRLSEPGLRHDIDVAPEQVLEAFFEAGQVEQRAARFQSNQEIEITVARLFTTVYAA
jgi:hypothetical protein